MTSVDASKPPLIAELDYAPSLSSIVLMESALLEIARTDAAAAGNSAALSRFMARTESVASSKIERITASARDYARAVAGNRSNASATSMVAASAALHRLVTAVGPEVAWTQDHLLDAHRDLMTDDPLESSYAGRLRDMQNWIGGSDHSPRGALYVPPVPERVEGLMADLVAYLRRDDVPVLVQAAIGHAQFESIHGFTDGNGRIGRALVSAVLRHRGVTGHSVLPIASGLLARREEYFDALGTYRSGDPAPLIDLFSRSALAAAACSRTTMMRLSEIPVEWTTELRPRRGSALASLIPAFSEEPVMGLADAELRSGAGEVQTYRAIAQLDAAGFIEEITGRKRDRVWAATDVMAELDELDRRIGDVMRR